MGRRKECSTVWTTARIRTSRLAESGVCKSAPQGADSVPNTWRSAAGKGNTGPPDFGPLAPSLRRDHALPASQRPHPNPLLAHNVRPVQKISIILRAEAAPTSCNHRLYPHPSRTQQDIAHDSTRMAYIPPPLTFDFGLENLDSLPLEGCAAPVAQRSSHHLLHPWPILTRRRPPARAASSRRRRAPRATRSASRAAASAPTASRR